MKLNRRKLRKMILKEMDYAKSYKDPKYIEGFFGNPHPQNVFGRRTNTQKHVGTHNDKQWRMVADLSQPWAKAASRGDYNTREARVLIRLSAENRGQPAMYDEMGNPILLQPDHELFFR